MFSQLLHPVSPHHLTRLLFPVISCGAGSSLGCQERPLTHTHTWLLTDFRPKAETFIELSFMQTVKKLGKSVKYCFKS